MHGRRRVLYLVSACLLLLSMGWSSASAAPPAQAGKSIWTGLTGASEVPGPGDADGSGSATVVLNLGQGTICYELSVTNVDAVTMAHIHHGDASVAGPVVVHLVAPTDGSSDGCTSVDKALIKDILLNPAGYYVNVHSVANPAGAVRGQLG